jgi:hypothetical protein
MSIEDVRLDTSKPFDSHTIVVREMREAVLSGAGVPSLVRRSARNTLLADTRLDPIGRPATLVNS